MLYKSHVLPIHIIFSCQVASYMKYNKIQSLKYIRISLPIRYRCILFYYQMVYFRFQTVCTSI